MTHPSLTLCLRRCSRSPFFRSLASLALSLVSRALRRRRSSCSLVCSHTLLRSPNSVDELKSVYFSRRRAWMQMFSNQEIIKESHEREKWIEQLKEAMESRFTQWEAPLARHLAIEEAFNTSYQGFSTNMSSCLDARKQTHKLTAEEVVEVLSDCQQNALVLLDLALPKDVEQGAKDVQLQRLRERTAADLDKFTRTYAHDEPGLVDWLTSPVKSWEQRKLRTEKQPLAPLPTTYAEATKGYSVQRSAANVSVLVTRGDNSASSSPAVSAFARNESPPSAEPGSQCSGSVDGEAAPRVAEETDGASANAAGRASPHRSRNRKGVDSTPKDR